MRIYEKQYNFYKSLNSRSPWTTTKKLYYIMRRITNELYEFFNRYTRFSHKYDQLFALERELDESEKRYYNVYFDETRVNELEQAEKVFFNSLVYQAKNIKELLKNEIKIAPEPYGAMLKAVNAVCNHIINVSDNIHHCICEEMFGKILHGEEILVYIDNHDIISSDEGYMSAFINASTETNNPVQYFHCSVVSRSMLEYDTLMFELIQGEHEPETISYKPYSAEFIIPIDQNGKTSGYYNSNDELESINSENGWFIAKFVPEGHKIKNDSSSYVKGTMLTFASPPDYTQGKLIFKGRVSKADKDKIASTYPTISPCNPMKISQVLKENASDISEASIYNIGHGNFITLNDTDHVAKVIYDIGLPYEFPIKKALTTIENNYNSAYNELINVSPKLVIISHWDTDHYIGAYWNEKNVFDVPWIVTEYEADGYINPRRIMTYLKCNNKLYVVERQQAKGPKNQQPYAEYIATNYKFQLYTGYGSSSPITKLNCQGIAIRIEHDKVATLMCGDIPYNCLSDNIIVQNEYEYFVVPHHASDMSQHSYDALAKIKSINYPIICVNNKDKLGKTDVDVDNGEHCQNVKKLSSNKVYFTDDDTHSLVNEYICDLTSINSLTKK